MARASTAPTIALLAGFALAACSNVPWLHSGREQNTRTSTAMIPPQVTPAPLQPPAKFPKPKRMRSARANPPPTTPQPKPDAGSLAVPSVIGLSQDDVRRTWGEPKERIAQSPGEAWVYSNARCKVEILFFLDVTRNGYYALDRKITGTDGSDNAAKACLSEIQNARQ
jgi:hypothetical protein